MRPSNLSKAANLLLIWLPFVVLVGWLYFKIFQFQFLGEYFLDGLMTLQLSRGWLEGRPLLFDTYTGFHALQHNYYFILLTGFITKFTGVYGLFLVYLGLVVLFLGKWFRWLRQFQKARWQNEWIIVGFMITGPFAYHIFLDYLGWHPEQYFIPLMGLLALSLAQRQWVWALCWGGLIFSVKETAPILICGLLLFTSVVNHVLKNNTQPWTAYFFNRQTIGIVMLSLFFFGLSMWWLSYINGEQSSRLNRIFEQVSQASLRQWSYYTAILGILSLLTVLLTLFPFLSWWGGIFRPKIMMGALIGFGGVLCLVFYLEGLYYFPVISPGIIYPPRIGGLWAFMLSCYVFLVIRNTEVHATAHFRQNEWTAWWVVLQCIFSPLLVLNNDVFTQSGLDGKKHLTFIMEYKAGWRPYPKNPEKLLYDLAHKLPTGAEVFCEKQYLNIFQQVYPISWSWNVRRPLVGRPFLYIYEKSSYLKNPIIIYFPKRVMSPFLTPHS
ncbi:MAG: hypothetical protein R2822_06640 [Spirosomataceae bacterium]